ncbi:MAG: hypothetical protein R3F11_09425 [Verrucomicrobiales bacterium]
MLFALKFALTIACVLAGAGGVFLGLVSLALAETSLTRVLAAALMLGASALTMVIFGLRTQKGTGHRLFRLGLLHGVDAFVLLSLCASRSPSGQPPEGARFSSEFYDGARFDHGSMSNLVPEIDQVKIGIHLNSGSNPLLAGAKGIRLEELCLGIYREMAAAPDFRTAGSALGRNYNEAFGDEPKPGHAFLYHPGAAEGERLPAIVFLHGEHGNLKAYYWVWKQFADDHRFAIIGPTFGAGNWEKPGGVEAVLGALEIVKRRDDIDPARVWLCGLSTGAKGVSRAGTAAEPGRFRGLIFISPRLDESSIGSDAFRNAWAGGRALIIHGRQDEITPIDRVSPQAEFLRSSNIDARLEVIEGEDHFLFFSQPEAIFTRIEPWIKSGDPSGEKMPL